MNKRKYRYFVGDFETTVYDGQVNTEVWASAVVELFNDEVKILNSIEETFNYLRSLDDNIIIYYHNLKFDGSFWLSYLMIDLGFKQACISNNDEDVNNFEWVDQPRMKNKTFNYSISNMGQWYRITIKIDDHIIEIRDSYKLLPFSVRRIGDSFKTKHKKLDMEYKGLRYAGCEISEEERNYIANDVLVVKEALEIMFNEGHKKLTIGSCCLSEYKGLVGNKTYKKDFPNVFNIEIDKSFGSENAGEYIRKSYKGGWCYLVKGKEKRLYKNGITADVNSLYPSMMASESNNRYPIGEPTFWKGNFIPDEALENNKYFFIRIRTQFYIKKDKLPFIQIKNSLLYKGTEALETSDIYDYKTDKYYSEYIDFDGTIRKAEVVLTLTMTDYKLLLEHYELVNFEILDGCYFNSAIGIFDTYIEKYRKIKMESKGALRELAKLFLNNLYGKMASSTDSSFKVAYIKDDKSIGFYTVKSNDKMPGYIPVGSAITSYARNFTIRAAQLNYHGKEKPGFIYADTDSIHCDLLPCDIKGVTIDDKKFCCWKLESGWDEGFFVRQKTYIEHVVSENMINIDKPYYSIKCAGMPDKCKELFKISMEGEYNETDFNEEELDFIKKKRSIEDFTIGLKVPGKLLPRRIPGGVVLVDTVYEMR